MDNQPTFLPRACRPDVPRGTRLSLLPDGLPTGTAAFDFTLALDKGGAECRPLHQ